MVPREKLSRPIRDEKAFLFLANQKVEIEKILLSYTHKRKLRLFGRLKARAPSFLYPKKGVGKWLLFLKSVNHVNKVKEGAFIGL